MPAPLRPTTLEEALGILARPLLVQLTADGQPPRVQSHALLMDTSRISEMAGIHRSGGELVVGLNNSWAGLIRSKLLRPAAACLVDAAEWMEETHPGGVLLHALDATLPDSQAMLSLAALDAWVEIAVRDSSGRASRRMLPIPAALQNPPEQPHLPLTLRFSLPLLAAGSALYRKEDLDPMRPDAQSAAALLLLDSDTSQVIGGRLVLAAPGRWPRLCAAVDVLVGCQPGPEDIEIAARKASQDCSPPGDDARQFSLALSAHLVRETLDRALARALAG